MEKIIMGAGLRSPVVAAALAAALAGCSAVDRALPLGSSGLPAGFSKPAPSGFVAAGPQGAAMKPPPQLNASAPSDPMVYIREAAEDASARGEPAAAAAHWAALAQADPKNLEAAWNAGRDLRIVGEYESSERILRTGLRSHPGEPRLLRELGKTLVADGRPREALDALSSAAPNNDPELLSTLGAAHDQLGESERAWAWHQQAMALAPDKAAILNNAGLSRALAGDPAEAERLLRAALSAPDADGRVRQNLALALALQGKSAEAEKILRRDLGRAETERLLAYYRTLVDQPEGWKKQGG